VIQEQEFQRVGGAEVIKVDIRLIAASHQKLLERVDQGLFRMDLYYRLNVFPLDVPPLRDRLDDIPGLVMSML
jgi:transcriptional regulator with GAF, ATPase, and Fis domain